MERAFAGDDDLRDNTIHMYTCMRYLETALLHTLGSGGLCLCSEEPPQYCSRLLESGHACRNSACHLTRLNDA